MKIAYLTFDDGPSRYTKAILDQLRNHRVKATFFVLGNRTFNGIRMYKRMVREGHAIGNHTFSHNYRVIYSSIPAFLKDFRKLESVLHRYVHVKPKIFRFPGGSLNAVNPKYGNRSKMIKVNQVMTRRGYRYFDWNVKSGDSEVPRPTTKAMIRNVLRGSKNKRKIIVLFHDFNPSTPKCLPAVIKGLRRQSFIFRALSKNSFTVRFR
ncbi:MULTISPECIES: polysaccharide deacetylase family protein [Paenibacillus]|uniref:polysaccharide deacetylase family protein n=1 Tax=Paenibacillus TaxID=44249 RepID=UPI0034DAF42B